MKDIKSKLARGVTWILITRLLVNMIGLASTVILARLLTPDDFGLVAIGTVILAIVNSFTDLALSSALIHRAELHEDHFHTTWTLSVVRGGLIGLALCIASVPISRAYHDPRLISLFLVLGLSTLISGAFNPKLTLLNKQLIFWQDFALGVGTKLIGLVIAIAVAVIYHSYWALVISAVVSQVANVVISFALYPYLPKISFSRFKDLFSYSVWLSLGQAISAINWNFDQLLVGYLLGKHPLGVYNFSSNLSALPTREAIAPVVRTLFPGFAALAQTPERLKSAYLKAQSGLTAVALPVGVGFAFLADPLIRLAVGDKWLDAIPIIQVLSLIPALNVLAMPVQSIALATGRTKVLFYRDLSFFFVRIPIIALGLWWGGLLGLVWARALSGLIGIAIEMSLVTGIIGTNVWQQLTINWRSFTSITAMALVLLAFENLFHFQSNPVGFVFRIACIATVGALVYASMLFATWHLSGRPPGLEDEMVRLTRKILPTRGVQRSPDKPDDF